MFNSLGEKKQETESSYTYLWVLIYLKLTIICDCTIGDIERNLHKICSMRSSALKIMLCLLLSFTVFRIEASPNIYSISGRISDERAGSPIDKKKIELETKDIKDAGVFNAKVRLHVGVVASFKIMVEVEQA